MEGGLRRFLQVASSKREASGLDPEAVHGLSEEGRRFLEEHKLLRTGETLQEIYDRVEKTAEVERYESAPCPEG